MYILLVADTRLYTLPCRSVRPSVRPSVGNNFELRTVFALLLLPNRPRLSCRVYSLVLLENSLRLCTDKHDLQNSRSKIQMGLFILIGRHDLKDTWWRQWGRTTINVFTSSLTKFDKPQRPVQEGPLFYLFSAFIAEFDVNLVRIRILLKTRPFTRLPKSYVGWQGQW